MIDYVHLAYLLVGIGIGGVLEYLYGDKIRGKVKAWRSLVIADVHPTDPPIPKLK